METGGIQRDALANFDCQINILHSNGVSDTSRHEIIRDILYCEVFSPPTSRCEVLESNSVISRRWLSLHWVTVSVVGSFSGILVVPSHILAQRRCNITVTNTWWEGFCHRHPNITLRTPAPLSKAHAAASDPEVAYRYFDSEMRENGIIDKPYQIFYSDESAMPLDPGQAVCVGKENALVPSSGDKTQITVVACASESGNCIPPMVKYFDLLE